jgi:NTP pyrophosphatase (non-canonical NTP hydrolase)
MNRLEELLVILQEESAEVSQAAAKCIRFGMDSEFMGKTNRFRLEQELGDLLAMIKLISEVTVLDENHIFASADAKMVKVEKFMKNSKNPRAS